MKNYNTQGYINSMMRNASHFYNAVMIAYADKELSEGEQSFLSTLAEKYNIGKNELKLIKTGGFENNILKPDSIDQRFEQLLELVLMMLADGEADEREMEICIKVATDYGFHKSIVEGIMKVLRELHEGIYKEPVPGFEELLEFMKRKLKRMIKEKRTSTSRNYRIVGDERKEMFRKAMGFKSGLI